MAERSVSLDPVEGGPMPPPLLRCSTCKTFKTQSEFTASQATGKGRCRECVRIRQRSYRDANPERLKVSHANYYQDNKDRIKVLRHKRIADNKAGIAKRTAELRSLNSEHVKRVQRDWYQRNKDKVRPQRRDYMRRYNQEDTRRGLLKAARVRAKRKGLDCTLTLEDIFIPEYCPMIGIKLAPGNGRIHAASPSLDRIDNSKGYVPGNVWVISQRANSAKNILTPEQLLSFARAIIAKFQVEEV